jgi:hypothetical protein
LGPPGGGKTHLAIAFGRAAIRDGYSVLLTTAPALVAALAKAHAEGRLEEKLGFFAKPKLLIIDELGYLPFESNAAHLFFQLISRRYERGSVLITSNRSVGEWGTVFGDPVVATAILDRCCTTARSSRSAREAPLGPDQDLAASGAVAGMSGDANLERGSPPGAHRNPPRSAPPDSQRSLRSARVPPAGSGTTRSAGGRHQLRGSVLRVARGSVPDVA